MSQTVPQKILKFFSKYYNNFKYSIDKWKADAIRRKRIAIEKKIVRGVFKKKILPSFAQIKYLQHFLNKNEKRTLVFFTFLLIVSVFGISSSWYFNNTALVPAKGGEYIEGIVGYPRFINPLYSQNNEVDKDLVELIYSGLTKHNVRGLATLDLAEKYEMSDDEKVYTFTLKKDVLWHDGEPLIADDIVFTINTIKDKNYNSNLRESWAGIQIEKIDDYTVKFKLEEVYSSFLSLASVKILPKHIWEKVPVASINLAEANTKPIGSGSYKFKSFTKDKVGVIRSYKLEKNDKYYDTKPTIDTITLKFYPDYVSAVNALDNRQIDALAFVPKEARSLLKLKNRFDSYEIFLPQYDALFLNQANNGLLKDKSVRLAMAMAIDRQKIIDDALGGDGYTVNSPVLNNFLNYEVKKEDLRHDVDGSIKLLVDAGWVLKDGNKIREKDNKQLKIAITTLDKAQNIKAINIIKENLENVGVGVELKIVSLEEITNEVINKRNYEVLFFGEMLSPELDLYPYWHSSALKYPGLNLAQYSNRQTDALLEQARRASSMLVKQEKYKEFDSLLKEDFPTIFLWQPKYVYLIDKKIKGVQASSIVTPSDRFTYITSSFINTKRVLK